MVGIRLPELDLDQELEPREKQENEEKEGGLSKLDESMSVIANDLEGQVMSAIELSNHSTRRSISRTRI